MDSKKSKSKNLEYISNNPIFNNIAQLQKDYINHPYYGNPAIANIQKIQGLGNLLSKIPSMGSPFQESNKISKKINEQYADVASVMKKQGIANSISRISSMASPFQELNKISKKINEQYADVASVMKKQGIANSIFKISLMGSPLQELNKTIQQINFSAVTKRNDLTAISTLQKQIQSVIQSLPNENYELLLESAEQVSPSFSSSLENFYTGAFNNDIGPSEVTDNSEVVASAPTIQESENSGSLWYLRLFTHILMCLMIPFSNGISDEISEWHTEFYEDIFKINLTGEINASIRKDTYLRKGRSKQAPIVLKKKLKQAQPIIWHERKGNWVKVSVYMEDRTYKGWVEKSKILK